MGFLDKIMDTMHLGSDDYDDDYDYDEDDFEEERPKRSSVFKKKERDFDYDMEDDVIADSGKVKAVKQPSRITPMRSKKTGSGMEVCVFKPTLFEEAREITDTLLGNRTVVLNLEKCQDEPARRILDFLGGAAFANNGTVKPIAQKTFLLTPSNVDLMGDLLSDLADNGFTLH